jgi:BON domain/zinc-ribbon domain
MFCRQCGTEIISGAKFCRSCGAPVAGIKAPEATQRAAAAMFPANDVVAAPLPATPPVPSPTPRVAASARTATASPGFDLKETVEMPAVPWTAPVAVQPVAVAPTRRSAAIWILLVVILLVAVMAAVLFRGRSPQATASDADLQQSIVNKFAADPNLNQRAVEVTAKAGIVTLSGSVNNDSERNTADQIVLRQAGVKTVVDNLVVGDGGH